MEGAKAAIEAKKAEWKRHFEENNLKAIGEIYAVDCKLLPHGKPTVHGRHDIPDGLKELRMKGTTSLSWETDELGPMTGNGDVIFELGNYKFLKSDGSSVTEGKHVVIWKKASNGYEMYIDIFNENK
ncbi:uncharacterized protein LOC119740789 isoform X2 [Patiria miniata]|uniref:DUF4440 domain-containing protein n=1 Tax=Patiria miniata TaxID=46514 RepID=A0A914B834_PATMI|nr:uncharacterized protein LOC119740789 isoform X2 [Patiria miniata]